MKLREELDFFSQEMEKILRQNDHKGGHSDCTDEQLYDSTLEELFELFRELRPDLSPHFDIDAEKVIKECCDVANFVMMIADNYRRKEVMEAVHYIKEAKSAIKMRREEK